MKIKLITTHADYWLIVDLEAEKTEDCWYYNVVRNQLNRLRYIDENDYKIIAHLPKGNAPKLEGVDLLPSINTDPLDKRKPVYMVQNKKGGVNGNLTFDVQLFEDLDEATKWVNGREHLQIMTEWIVAKELPNEEDVEQLAEDFGDACFPLDKEMAYQVSIGYETGYKADKQSEKKYSELQLRNAMNCVYSWMIPESGNLHGRFPRATSLDVLINNFIEDNQSLSTTKELIDFDVEMEDYLTELAVNGSFTNWRPKVIGGVVQGKWIYK
jgi:hypothetical protein